MNEEFNEGKSVATAKYADLDTPPGTSPSWPFIGIQSKHLILLALLGLFLWAATCGLWDLRGPDEGRYVQIAKELLERKDWLRLTLHEQAYNQKPPLAFWMIATSLDLFGEESLSWAARIPAVCMGILTVLLVYLLALRASSGSTNAAFVSAIVMMTFPLFLENVPQAELNVPFTFWITAAVSCWYLSALTPRTPQLQKALLAAGFWIALAAAFFTKGPLALLIVACPIVAAMWHTRRIAPLRIINPVAGGLFLLLLIAGWLLTEYRIYGAAFVREQVGGETMDRFLHGDHAEPSWYYLTRLPAALLPWIVLLPFAVRDLWNRRRSEAFGNLLPFFAWSIVPFVFLSIATGKRQAYLLPLLPAAAVLAGCWIAQFGQQAEGSSGVALKPGSKPLLKVCGALWAVFAISLLAASTWLLVRGTSYGGLSFSKLVPYTWLLCSVAAAAVSRAHFGRQPAKWAIRESSRGIPFAFASSSTLLLVICFLRFVTVEPALDPVKSTQQFALDIDADGIGYIGALSDAARPQYHVYGNYRVQELSRKRLRANKDLPDLLIADEPDARSTSESLEQCGYRKMRTIETCGTRLVLLSRVENSERTHLDAAARSLRFVLMGDTGTGDERIRNNVKQIVQQHERSTLDSVFLLGDNMYEGDDFQGSVDSLFTQPFDPVLRTGIAIHTALGNHDYKNLRWRGELRHAPFGMHGRRYYTESYGNAVTFFILDSESLASKAGDPAQVAWLQSRLAACHSTWKIVLLHRPIKASNIDHGPAREVAMALKPVLAGAHGDIDMIISGHNHLYERRRVDVDGILHVTIGCGGKLTEEQFQTQDAKRVVGYRDSGAFVLLEINGEKAQLTAISESGKVIDSASLHDVEPAGGKAIVKVAAHND